jgi:hypothetical protein
MQFGSTGGRKAEGGCLLRPWKPDAQLAPRLWKAARRSLLMGPFATEKARAVSLRGPKCADLLPGNGAQSEQRGPGQRA